MSEAATNIARREGMMAEAVKDFVKKHFPEFALNGIEVDSARPPVSQKAMPSPDDLARELVETLFPELRGDFSPSAMHRRSIATIVGKKYILKVVEHLEEAMRLGSQQNDSMRAGLKLAQSALRSNDVTIADLRSELAQAIELRGVHADKAKETLQVKLDNAERAHAEAQRLLQTTTNDLKAARGELEIEKGKGRSLAADLSLLMKAVSGNAEAPKRADAWLAAAVEKCYEFWGENARRSPTAQLVLADLIKARVELQALTLLGAKPEQEKTG